MKAVLDYATAQRTAIHDNLPAVRDGDPDAIHDMRVAIRRIRSTLRTFRGLWDRERSEGLRSELKWLGARLGKVRDGQVMSANLSGAVHSEPPELVAGPVAARLQRRLAGQTLPAQEELRETLEEKFPTCALAVITFDAKAWADIAPGTGTLARFLTPARLT